MMQFYFQNDKRLMVKIEIEMGGEKKMELLNREK